MPKKDREAIQRLAEANPVDERLVDDSDTDRAQDLLNQAISSPYDESTGRRRRIVTPRRAVLMGVSALILVAAALYATRSIDEPTAILCYQDVDVGSDIAAAPAGGPAIANACQQPWVDGTLTNPHVVEPGDVPPLTACVNDDGALAVFPTDNLGICEDLGMARPDTGDQGAADAVRQLEKDLITFALNNNCPSLQDAEVAARRSLDTNALNDWTIQPATPTDERPCVGFSVDSSRNAVVLVTEPRPPT